MIVYSARRCMVGDECNLYGIFSSLELAKSSNDESQCDFHIVTESEVDSVSEPKLVAIKYAGKEWMAM